MHVLCHELHVSLEREPFPPFCVAGVGDAGCEFIKDLLLGNTSIQTLDLNMNQITDRGCRCVHRKTSVHLHVMPW